MEKRINDLKSRIRINFDELLKLMSILVVCIVSFYLIKSDLCLFHTGVEIFSMVIGYSIGLIALNTHDYCKDTFFTFLAIAYCFTGTLDLIYILSFKGFVINNKEMINSYMQLAQGKRYMECISILIAFKMINKKINIKKVFCSYLLITILVILSIFKLHIFPNCYIEGNGITRFMNVSKYVFFFLFSCSVYLLNKNKEQFDNQSFTLLNLFIIFSLLSYFSHIILINDKCISRLVGYLFKLIAYFLLYWAIIKATLRVPYKSIFKELNDKAKELEKLNTILNTKNEELKKTKINVQKNKNKYKKFLEFLPDAVIVRENHKITYVNKAFIDLFKFNMKKEVINQNIFSVMPKQCHNLINKETEYVNKYEEIIFSEEKVMNNKEQEMDVEISTIPIDLENKKHYMSVIRSIEERKQFERLKMELEQNENLGVEFFANFSHELRTPLNVICSALQLQQLYIDKKDLSNMKKYNCIAKQNCSRLLKLCNNLIDSTKIEAGFLKPNMKCCNIVELIEDIICSVIPYVNSKNLNIIFDTEIEEKFVMCDLEFMERIMLNLLSNAIKFSNVNGHILVSIYDRKNYIMISIKDNGIGIVQSKQRAIFERFIQVDKSFRRKCEGSGIGLSLVKSFVEMQGGNISCISEEGKGAEFIIKFPCSEALDQCSVTSTDYKVEKYKIYEKVCIEFADIY